MQTIYFHIGLPKTGTSYLQGAFAVNSEHYRSFNLIYPDLEENFVYARLGNTTSGNGVRIAADSDIEKLKHICKYDLKNLCNSFEENSHYLISSEWLCFCPLIFFEKIFDIFSKKFNVQYIALIRNPAERIFSVYLQRLKIGIFSKDIEFYIDDLIQEERQFFRLIHNLSPSIRIINYDVHKSALLEGFDRLLFCHSVSRKPDFAIVNPSPNRRQGELLKLASKLGISNFGKSMSYVETSSSYFSTKEGFSLSKLLCEKVFSNLKSEIVLLNSMLPSNERIINSCDGNSESVSQPLFTDQDVEFLRCLIGQRQVLTDANCDYIIKWVSEFQSNHPSKLPKDFNMLAYLLRNPDIMRAGVDPILHYLDYGCREGRRYK